MQEQWKHNARRSLCLLLVVAMLIGLLPVSAFAMPEPGADLLEEMPLAMDLPSIDAGEAQYIDNARNNGMMEVTFVLQTDMAVWYPSLDVVPNSITIQVPYGGTIGFSMPDAVPHPINLSGDWFFDGWRLTHENSEELPIWPMRIYDPMEIAFRPVVTNRTYTTNITVVAQVPWLRATFLLNGGNINGDTQNRIHSWRYFPEEDTTQNYLYRFVFGEGRVEHTTRDNHRFLGWRQLIPEHPSPTLLYTHAEVATHLVELGINRLYEAQWELLSPTIEKSAPGTTIANVNDRITYEISVTNPHNQALVGDFVVRDILDANVNFATDFIIEVAGDSSYVVNTAGPDEVVVTLNGLPAESTTVIRFQAIVASGAVNAGEVRNRASVQPPVIPALPGGSPTTPPPVESNEVVVPVRGVTVVKEANVEEVVAGGQIEYTITVTNIGGANLTNLTVTDRLPNWVTFNDASGNGSHTGANVVTGYGGTVTWTIPSLPHAAPNNEVVFTVTVDVSEDAPAIDPNAPPVVAPAVPVGVLRNTVVVTGGGLDPDNPPTDYEEVDVVEPGVTVVKTANVGEVVAGGRIVYTIRVTNTGNTNLTALTVTDTLPNWVTFYEASGNGSHAGANAYGYGGTVTWTIARLPHALPNETPHPYVELTVIVDVSDDAPTGILRNTVVVSGDDLDDDEEDYEEVEVVEPGLSVRKTANVGEVVAGGRIVYTIRVTNTGDEPLTELTVTDNLPNWVEFVSATGGGVHAGANANGYAGTVTWTIANLSNVAPNNVVTFTVIVDVSEDAPTGILRNTVVVSGDDLDDDEEDYEEVDVVRPTLTKAANRTTAAVNDRIIYTLTVTNPGEALEDFVVVDRLNTTFVRFERATLRVNNEVVADEDMSFINGVLRVYIDLPEDSVTTITFEVTVLPAAAGRTITNTAILQGSPDEPGGDRPQVGPETPPVNVVVPPTGGGNGGGEPGGDDPWRQAFLIGRTVPAGQERPIAPRDNITRAEVATIFFRLIEDEVREEYWMQTNPFDDVELQNWFNNAISTTHNMGLLRGIGGTSFAPNQNITRGELAAVLVRFMERDQIGAFSLSLNDGDQFNDIVSHWAREYINEAARQGWVLGYADGTFRPSQPITRAETAAMINRLFQRLIETPECRLYDMVTWPDNQNQNSWYFLYMYMATNSYTYRWRTDAHPYKELIEIIDPREWWRLERPNSRPEHIFLSSPQASV